MARVLGIDPGSKGAFAVYDNDTRDLVHDVLDMPVWYQVVGKRKRPRLDGVAIAEMFELFDLLSIELIVIEAVGGRPRESPTHAFTFGYGVGMLYMAAIYSGHPLETVPPAAWKQTLKVPGKGKADDTAILARADELFPERRDQFRGPRDGAKVDRAEAAMIAKYGGDFILREGLSTAPLAELYRSADTGA